MKKLGSIAINSKEKEIRDKDLQNIYRLCEIKKFEAGDFVFTENSSEPYVYLFVEGELDVLKDHSENTHEIVRLEQDKGSDGIAFIAHAPWQFAARAARTSTVLLLRKAVFESLDENLQLYFYKRYYRFDKNIVDKILATQSEMGRLKQQFESCMLSMQSSTKADYEKSELINGILKKIPRLPAFTGNLATSMMDDRLSAKDVAELVKEDPSLAAAVMKTVNSPYYGFGNNISDINHAIILLGFNELYQLVIADGIKRSMPNSASFRDLFMHSICISRIAFALSIASRVGKPAEVSTIGLLHDLGRSLTHLLKKQNPKIGILIDSIDTAAIGAVMMERWNLPGKVWQSIELQNYPRFASPDKIPDALRDNVAILYLSHLCYDFYEGDVDSGKDSPFTEDYIKLFGVEGDSVQSVAKKCILPVLMKNQQSYPAFFRKLITRHGPRYSILN